MKTNFGAGATGALSGAATGAALGSFVPGIGTGLGAVGGGLVGGLSGLFSGGQKKEKIRPQSLLRPEQEQLYEQALNAGLSPGAGGAFGTAADYYRNLMSDDNADFNAFAAPQLRQYNEEIVPGLSEQFAGMGAGGLSSSGFRNAQVQGATDLSERLGAIRASLRQSGAQGLQNIGQLGLGRFSENVRNTPQAGFSENLAEGIGNILPSVASWYLNQPSGGNKVGANTTPNFSSNGNFSASAKPAASPAINTKLPDFQWR